MTFILTDADYGNRLRAWDTTYSLMDFVDKFSTPRFESFVSKPKFFFVQAHHRSLHRSIVNFRTLYEEFNPINKMMIVFDAGNPDFVSLITEALLTNNFAKKFMYVYNNSKF